MFAFEIASLLLLVAIIGAVGDGEEENLVPST